MVGGADVSGPVVQKVLRGKLFFARLMGVVGDVPSWAVQRVLKEKPTTALLMVGDADATT
jgi:hypothetical protein